MTKMSMDMMSIIDRCAQIELKNMELYDLLADCFKEEVSLARMWHKLAREEENHASQFQLAAKLKSGGIEAISLDPWAVENMRKVIQSIIDGVGRHKPTLADAVRSALKLEEHLTSFHMDCIASFSEPGIKQLFHAMMAADNQHLKTLTDLQSSLVKK